MIGPATGFDLELLADAIVESVPLSAWYGFQNVTSGSQKISDFTRAAHAWIPFQGTLWERVSS